MRQTLRCSMLLFLLAVGCKNPSTTTSASTRTNFSLFTTKEPADVGWIFPRPALKRVGTEQVLVTSVSHKSDSQPLGNTRVRYRIIDGPKAYFVSSKAQDEIVVSDSNGNATTTIAQPAPLAGVNRIGVDVLGAPNPAVPGDPGVVLGHGETSVEWQAATITIAINGPTSIAVNQDVSYTLTLTNMSQVETKFLTVSYPIPDGLTYKGAQPPPASTDKNQLIWTLGELAAGQGRNLKVDFHTAKDGTAAHQVTVTTDEGRKTEQKLALLIASPQLKVTKTGPPTGAVNVPLTYQVTVTNTGTGPATNVMLEDKLEPGLTHVSKDQLLRLPIGTLGPGQSQTVPQVLTPQQAGKLASRVTATADGHPAVTADSAVDVQDGKLEVKITGPAWRYADRPAEWTIEVHNASTLPLPQVELRDTMPRELGFQSATESGQWTPANGVVTWKLGDLAAGASKSVRLTATGVRVAPRAVQSVAASAASGLQGKGEAVVEIRGLPALRMDVVDLKDPVEVGGTTTYRIDVDNVGSLEANQVEVLATVPAEMRVQSATGPSPWRQEGSNLVFAPVNGVQPKRTLTYYVQVQATNAASVVFHVELRSVTLTKVVIAEEPTVIYQPLGGSRPNPVMPVSYPQGPQTNEPPLQPIPVSNGAR